MKNGNKPLEHSGVLGMRWGHHKSESSGDVGRDVFVKRGIPRTIHNNSIIGLTAKKKPEFTSKDISGKAGSDPVKMSNAQKRAAKALAKMANKQKEADDLRAQAKGDVEELVSYTKERAAKRKQPFDEAKTRQQWEKTYAFELNATPESIHKQRVKEGIIKTGIILAGIGYLAVGSYLSNH
jgi:hypothetical protein